MRRVQTSLGQTMNTRSAHLKKQEQSSDDFVLEKSIFNNIFEKDIRRVFIYKKAERLAKAIHLIAPAFTETASLRNRIDAIAVGLVDAAILPPGAARAALSRELLTLSSVLSIARTGGLLSSMNAELIANEAHTLLQEVAVYEEPRLFLDDAPTLSGIAKKTVRQEQFTSRQSHEQAAHGTRKPKGAPVKDIKDIRSIARRDSVLSIIREKGKASIKDISTKFRDVSEKTIQRELAALVSEGFVQKEGERRWSVYSLVNKSGE